ncbi:MAG TPA: DUF4349 domain-containing protein [Lutibacter sp.]|nr:DUF4349 domain-containing protein [Lutibacter sp.]
MKKILFLFSLLVMSFSCQDMRKENMPNFEGSPAVYDDMEEIVMEEAREVSYKNTTSSQQVQKIIKTGYFTFETQSVDQSYASISTWVRTHKGMIQSDRTNKEYDRIHRTLLVRIPSESFQPMVDSIIKSAKTLDRRDVSKKDVTEEFVDLQARLKAKRKLEERYLQLLSKARNVKDMLEIERQLANIREEIEAKQGRLKYLQSQVSMSTIHLDFYEMIATVKAPSQTYLSRLWRAAKGGFTGIGNFLIGVVYLWPFILIGIFVVFFIKRTIRKRKNK